VRIKNRQDFFSELFLYYPEIAENLKIKKMNRIKLAIQSDQYDFDTMYDSITKENYYGKFPGFDDIKETIYKNRIRPKTYENTPDQIHNVNGLWVCEFCKGKQGEMYLKIINGVEYDFFRTCKTCNGDGQKLGHNIFIKWMTPEELGNDKNWIQMMSLIKRKAEITKF